MAVSIEVKQQSSEVPPLLLTIPQVMACMNLKRNKIYDLINNEGLPVQRFGRAVRVYLPALNAWLEQRQREL